MKKIMMLLCAAIVAISCGNPPESTANVAGNETDKVEVLKKDIMEVHDKTMAQMGPMRSLEKELYEARVAGKLDAEAAQNVINDLRMAHEDMMAWMRGFENPDEMEATVDEKVAYLKNEKEKIEQLEEYTNRSIERGKLLLAEIK